MKLSKNKLKMNKSTLIKSYVCRWASANEKLLHSQSLTCLFHFQVTTADWRSHSRKATLWLVQTGLATCQPYLSKTMAVLFWEPRCHLLLSSLRMEQQPSFLFMSLLGTFCHMPCPVSRSHLVCCVAQCEP